MNLLDLFFPKQCLECGTNGRYICETCFRKVGTSNLSSRNNYSVFKYQGVIRKALISLKYKFATDIADELIERITSSLIIPTNNYCLVPIPLHRQRENWRGFNQAELIGKKLAEKMKWDFLPNLLIRIKKTSQQVGLKNFERYKNVSDAFITNTNISISKSKHILLLDDVYTTGSTINEARKVLISQGFKRVVSLIIAS